MTNDDTKPSRIPIGHFAVLLGAMLLTFVFHGSKRAAVFTVGLPLAMMLLSSSSWFQSKLGLLRIFSITAAVLALVFACRWHWAPDAFFGGMIAQISAAFYVVVAGTTLAASACTWFAFNQKWILYKWRWLVLTLFVGIVVALGAIVQRAEIGLSSSAILRAIATHEQPDDQERYARQELSVLLSISGRELEAELIADSRGNPSTSSVAFTANEIEPLPWRETIEDIARREQLVIVMEAHNAPKHRQWIEQALPIFHRAGFRDYAAETLAPMTRALQLRGYPTNTTGYYSADPSFGNLLRTASNLGFRFHAYDSLVTDFQRREINQAQNIADLVAANPDRKFLIHAGYGHVLKTPDEYGHVMMAGHLWEMTGVEPYCIYQTWHSPEETESNQLSKLIEASGEIKMLTPPPTGIENGQLNFPDGAVDAIVVHSPSVGGPATREHCFPLQRKRITGKWLGNEWPVLIGAFKKNESPMAIALDQVMLKTNEREFVLWVPDTPHEIRVFNTNGQMNTGSDLLEFEQ